MVPSHTRGRAGEGKPSFPPALSAAERHRIPRALVKAVAAATPTLPHDAAGQALIYGRYLTSGPNETFCFQALFLF